MASRNKSMIQPHAFFYSNTARICLCKWSLGIGPTVNRRVNSVSSTCVSFTALLTARKPWLHDGTANRCVAFEEWFAELDDNWRSSKLSPSHLEANRQTSVSAWCEQRGSGGVRASSAFVDGRPNAGSIESSLLWKDGRRTDPEVCWKSLRLFVKNCTPARRLFR